MDEEYGRIEGTNFYNPVGILERIEYEWKGKSPLCVISTDFLAGFGIFGKNKIIQIGPYHLRLVDDNENGCYWYQLTYIRLDYPLWWLLVFWHRINSAFDLVYRRMIFTMVVWGLADHDPAAIPTWRDIKVVKWLTKRYRK